MPVALSREQALSVVNALRAGTVPQEGLEAYAVGLEPQMEALRRQLAFVGSGKSAYKFVRGDYGSGKTFLTSLAASEAPEAGFLFSKVVVSSSDTPLYKLSEIYRKLCQGLSVSPGRPGGALRSLVDRWLYTLEQKVIELHGLDESSDGFVPAVARQVQEQLAVLGDRAGRMAACLAAYHQAQMEQDYLQARAILDWMAGEPKVAAALKKSAGVTGQLDNTDALVFLRGLLELIRSAGYKGLVVVLDEVETVLRLRRPERAKSLEVLRQLVDACDRHEFPGLYLLFTGTPDFFDSHQGVPSLQPLHDRIHVTFDADKPDNLRAPQIRLRAFDYDRLLEVARRIRDIYPAETGVDRVNDGVIRALADRVTRGFGGRVDVVPRLFLREFVNTLDLVDQYPDYDPDSQGDYVPAELTPEEEAVLGGEAREVLL